jgi:hypothetical protein
LKAASRRRRARDYRSGAALTLAALGTVLAVLACAQTASARPDADGPNVTLAFLPSGTSPRAVAAVDGVSPGLLSAGLGRHVPADQTYLDIGQGNRAFNELYGDPLPRPLTIDGRIPAGLWRAVLERADSAPADIEPGLLATTLERAGRTAGATPAAGAGAITAANRAGRVRAPKREGMTVTSVGVGRLSSLVRSVRGEDLLIAIERPQPGEMGRQLSAGIAGRGFEGDLTSDSTRFDGLVLSTDLAPTILERLGIEVPDAVSGSPIRTQGEADPARLVSLERRMAAIGPRRGPVIGLNLLIWIGLVLVVVAVAGATGGAAGARDAAASALPVLALSGLYVPAMLLLGAALEPSETVERVLVGVGCPLLAVATLVLVSGYGAAAIACGVSVLAYAIDVVVGSPLTVLSLIGPNPVLGVRFFGIGNELEAAVATLIPLGVGAWLTASGPGSPRAAGAAFAAAGIVGIAVFAPGRFGADVGAAIVLPVGAAVAAWVMLGGGRRRLLLFATLPLLALAAVALIDLTLGGDAHLSRSVLEAGGLDDLADVVERRLRLSAGSFARNATKPSLLACVALIVTGWIVRRRILAWFEGRRPALAGLAGAIAATLVGTIANDSGAILLMIGTGFAAMFVALAWAVHVVRIN